jgi:phosphoglycerate dehydrogenase-like enzyme
MSTLIWVPLPQVVTALDGIGDVTVEVVDPDSGADLPESADRVEIYVPPLFPRQQAVDVLDRLPKLAVVQTLTAGIDTLRPRLPAGAVLCNARGVHDASVAEWVLTAILGSIRKIPFFAIEQQAGRWSTTFTGTLAGQTVLIVGAGSIGSAVERRLAGFDATVVKVARTARDGVHSTAELPDLLPQADVVVLLAPLTSATAGLVDRGFLAAMKDGALLVNGARGGLIDADDLTAELATGRLYAALDVTDPEPLPSGHQLWTTPNVLITPHAAATTWLSVTTVLGFLRAQVLRFKEHSPLVNVISGEY